MAYRFQTYTELGDFLKEVKPSLADRSSESLGLRFAERYGDKYKVRVAEESDRATFAYDPEEGFNLLKTLGNLPSSAGAMAEDVATAVMNPIDTAEALGRGVAGAAEMALGTDYSPENKRVAEQLGQGLAASAGFDKVGDEYQFTGRGIQERPLDILGMLAGGTSVGAKGAALGARAVGRAATAAGAADATSRAGRIAGAAERIGAAAQAADPAIAIPRAAYGATKGAVKGTVKSIGKGTRYIGNRFIAEPIRARYEGSKAQAAIDDIAGAIDGAEEFSPGLMGRIQGAVRSVGETLGAGKQSALELLERAEDAATRRLDKASMGTSGPVKAGGVFESLLTAWMGFTTGLGHQIIRNIIDYSRMDDQSFRKAMLEAASGKFGEGQKYGSVGQAIVDELANDLEKWSQSERKASRKTRNALKMDEVRVNTDELKRSIINDTDLVNNYGIRNAVKRTRVETEVQPGFAIGESAPLSSRTDIGREGRGPADQMPFVDRQTLDFQGRPAGQVPSFTVEDLRNVEIDLKGSPILDLGENVSAVNQAFNKVFKLPQNATVAQLDIAKRAIDDAIDATPGTANAALTRLRGIVYEQITKRYEDPEVLRALGIREGQANPYVQAMAEYERYDNAMRNIASTLKLKDPQRKFAGTELEVVRQSGNPQEVLRAVLNTFGDNEKELGLQNLVRLAEETGDNYLIPRIIGYAMSPIFGEGLVVRSEISQLGRAALGFNLIGGLLTPVALAQFSPKFGGMALSYLYSPEGQQLIRSVPDRAGQALSRAGQMVGVQTGQLGERISARFRGFRKVVSEYTGKPEGKITPADEQRTLTALQRLQQSVQQTLSREQQSTLQTLLQGGTMTQRAQEQGEQAQQRNNILSALGRTQR